MAYQLLGLLAVALAAEWLVLDTAFRVAGWLWRRQHRSGVSLAWAGFEED